MTDGGPGSARAAPVPTAMPHDLAGSAALLEPSAAAAAVASTHPPLARGIVAFVFLLVAEFFYSWA